MPITSLIPLFWPAPPIPAVVGRPKVTVQLADRFGMPLSSLAGSFARTWREERLRKGVGSGTVSVGRIDADAAALASENRIVRFMLGGVPVYAITLESPVQQTIAGSKKLVDEVLTVSGRGTIGLWEESQLDPELGVGRRSPDNRVFGFPSRYFNRSGWIAATEIKKVNVTPPFQWNDTVGPSGWPSAALSAWWIWTRPQGAIGNPLVPPQPIGSVPFARTFVVPQSADYGWAFTADDGLDAVYIDGEVVVSRVEAFLWGQTLAGELFLDAGEHTIAVKATNILRPHPEFNIAGILGAVMPLLAGGSEYGAPLVVTDSSWVCLDYPDPWPTMTPGEVVIIMRNEAVARGELPGITLGFTAAADSAGNAWASGVDLTFAVGTDYLSMLRVLAETVVDLRMDPGSLRLDMWNKPRGTATGVAYTRGVNVTDAKHSRQKVTMNAALEKLADSSYVEIIDPTSVAAYGRRRRYLQVGTAASSDQAQTTTDALFLEAAHVIDQVSMVVEPRDGLAETPYVDVFVDDVVDGPAFAGGELDTVVDAIAVAHDRLGYPIFTIEGTQVAD